MIRSIFVSQVSKMIGQTVATTLLRNISGQPSQRMEDYFKDKCFIVTGANAG